MNGELERGPVFVFREKAIKDVLEMTAVGNIFLFFTKRAAL